MKKINLILSLIMTVSLLTSCSKSEEKTKKQNTLKKAYKVSVLKVKPRSGKDEFTYSGTVVPKKKTPLSFLLPGNIVSITVDVGDQVHKGQVLAKIDDTSYKNAYKTTQASLSQAMDAYRRLKTVHDKGSLPEIKWEEVKSKLKQAEGANQIARKNLINTVLKAPVNGVIGMRRAELGEIVVTGVPILDIVNISELYVKIPVPENEINLYKKQQKANVVIPALGSKVIVGTVDKIAVVANRISKTYDVRIKIDNKDKAIKPGMACDVKLNVSYKEAIIKVPYKCIVKGFDDKIYLYTVDTETKTVHKKLIELGAFVNNEIEIKSGVKTGDIVVIDGQQKLLDNMEVTY